MNWGFWSWLWQYVLCQWQHPIFHTRKLANKYTSHIGSKVWNWKYQVLKMQTFIPDFLNNPNGLCINVNLFLTCWSLKLNLQQLTFNSAQSIPWSKCSLITGLFVNLASNITKPFSIEEIVEVTMEWYLKGSPEYSTTNFITAEYIVEKSYKQKHPDPIAWFYSWASFLK